MTHPGPKITHFGPGMTEEERSADLGGPAVSRCASGPYNWSQNLRPLRLLRVVFDQKTDEDVGIEGDHLRVAALRIASSMS